METVPGFAAPLLQYMVGTGQVGTHDAVLWARCSGGGRCRVELRAAREGAPTHVHSFEIERRGDADHTGSIHIRTGLEPSTTYTYRIEQSETGEVVGEGRFETAPERHKLVPQPFSFAVASCNEPFDKDGRSDERALELLRHTEDILEAQRCKRVLFVGDQMYTDLPESRSLFDPDYFRSLAPEGRTSIFECSRQQVRQLMHQRYRLYWSAPELQRIMARWSCDYMMDDHEIVDNYGTRPEHCELPFSTVRDGALDAFHDYQGQQVFGPDQERPFSFHHGFRYGPVATFTMDLRSHKRANDEEISFFEESQLDELKSFLEEHSDAQVVVLVLTIPILPVPGRVLAVASALSPRGDDALDRWSHPLAQRSRDRLLSALAKHGQRHPEQRVIIASGDVHVGLATEIVGEGGLPRLFQLTSSALTNEQGRWQEWLADHAPYLSKSMPLERRQDLRIRELQGEPGMDRQPYGGLNLGIIEFLPDHERRRLGVRLKLFGVDHGGPRVMYSSPVL